MQLGPHAPLRDAARRLAAHLGRRLREDPWHPCTVLVPSHRSGRYLAEFLARELGHLAGVRVATAEGLAEACGPPEPSPSPALSALLGETVLLRHQLPPRPALVRALLDVERRCREGAVELPAPAAATLAGRLLADLARLRREVPGGREARPAAVRVAEALRADPEAAGGHLDLWAPLTANVPEAQLLDRLRTRARAEVYLPEGAGDLPGGILEAASPLAEPILAAHYLADRVRQGVPPHLLAVVGGRSRLRQLAAQLALLGVPAEPPPGPAGHHPVGRAWVTLARLLAEDRAVDLLELLDGATADPAAAAALRWMVGQMDAGRASRRLAALPELRPAPGSAHGLAERAREMADWLAMAGAAARMEDWPAMAQAFFAAALLGAVPAQADAVWIALARRVEADLAGLAGADLAPPHPGRLARLLEAELAALPAPEALPERRGVRLLDWEDAAGALAEEVLLLGLGEEDFPPPPAENPLLGQLLEAVPALAGPLAADPGPRLERLLDQALAAAPRRVAVVSPDRGRYRQAPHPRVARWPALSPPPPVDPARRLAAAQPRPLPGEAADLLLRDRPRLRRAWQARQARTSAEGAAFRGILPPAARPTLPGRISVTHLELLGRCPYRYLAEVVWGIEGTWPDRSALEVTPPLLGQWVHAALQKVRQELRHREPWDPGTLQEAARRAAELLHAYLAGPEAPLLAQGAAAGLAADLAHHLAETAHRVTHDSEWDFGRLGGLPLPLADGESGMRVSGRVDWLAWEETPEGRRMVVTDFKTGHLPAAQPARDNLQLLIYLEAVHHFLGMARSELEGEYRSVTMAEGFRTARLAGAELEAGCPVWQVMVREVLAPLGSGEYRPRPQRSVCPTCPCLPFCPKEEGPPAEEEAP